MYRLKTSLILILLFTIIHISSCASSPSNIKNNSNHYQNSAERNTALANDYRTRGMDNKAEYHEEKADKARRNQYADDCSIFDFIISAIISDDYTCDLN